MPHVFPANFPFFEIAAPARCVLPDLSDLLISDNFSPVNPLSAGMLLQQLVNYPNVDDVKELIRNGYFRVTSVRPAPGTLPTNHWDVFTYLQEKMGSRIPPKACIPNCVGAAAERLAWDAALTLFAAGATPAWVPSVISPPVGWPAHQLLSLNGVLSSVWMDRADPKTPFVIDQLWVVSWVHQPSLSMIIGVEIDGDHKWDVDLDEWSQSPKDRSTQRSFEILAEKIALFRVSSRACDTSAGALHQIQSLWNRLTTAAFLHRMNFTSFVAQDLRDVDALFDLACRKHARDGQYAW